MERILRVSILVTLCLASPQYLFAQAFLEDPSQDSYQSGIGLIRGWSCQDGTIEVQIDDGPLWRTAHGTARADTRVVCGDDNNGFGMTYNWNNAGGDGFHRLRAYFNGTPFADVTFHVATLGEEFPRGIQSRWRIPHLAPDGRDAVIRWDESKQNFVIEQTLPSDNGGGGQLRNLNGVIVESEANFNQSKFCVCCAIRVQVRNTNSFPVTVHLLYDGLDSAERVIAITFVQTGTIEVLFLPQNSGSIELFGTWLPAVGGEANCSTIASFTLKEWRVDKYPF